jgi:hypothetical protein
MIVGTLMFFVCRRSTSSKKENSKKIFLIEFLKDIFIHSSFKNKDTRKNNNNNLSVIEMEANNNNNNNNNKNNLRLNQNDDLTTNPVYGDVNLKNMNQQRKTQVLNERETTAPSASNFFFISSTNYI